MCVKRPQIRLIFEILFTGIATDLDSLRISFIGKTCQYIQNILFISIKPTGLADIKCQVVFSALHYKALHQSSITPMACLLL